MTKISTTLALMAGLLAIGCADGGNGSEGTDMTDMGARVLMGQGMDALLDVDKVAYNVLESSDTFTACPSDGVTVEYGLRTEGPFVEALNYEFREDDVNAFLVTESNGDMHIGVLHHIEGETVCATPDVSLGNNDVAYIAGISAVEFEDGCFGIQPLTARDYLFRQGDYEAFTHKGREVIVDEDDYNSQFDGFPMEVAQ